MPDISEERTLAKIYMLSAAEEAFKELERLEANFAEKSDALPSEFKTAFPLKEITKARAGLKSLVVRRRRLLMPRH